MQVPRQGSTVSEFMFVLVDDPNNVPSTIAATLNDYFLLIFEATLYVNDQEQRLGFGKN